MTMNGASVIVYDSTGRRNRDAEIEMQRKRERGIMEAVMNRRAVAVTYRIIVPHDCVACTSCRMTSLRCTAT